MSAHRAHAWGTPGWYGRPAGQADAPRAMHRTARMVSFSQDAHGSSTTLQILERPPARPTASPPARQLPGRRSTWLRCCARATAIQRRQHFVHHPHQPLIDAHGRQRHEHSRSDHGRHRCTAFELLLVMVEIGDVILHRECPAARSIARDTCADTVSQRSAQQYRDNDSSHDPAGSVSLRQRLCRANSRSPPLLLRASRQCRKRTRQFPLRMHARSVRNRRR